MSNCENCHHYNTLIHWSEGVFEQCMMHNELNNENCKDYDPIKNIEQMIDRLNKQEEMIQSQEKQLQKQHRIIEEQDKRIMKLERMLEEFTLLNFIK